MKKLLGVIAALFVSMLILGEPVESKASLSRTRYATETAIAGERIAVRVGCPRGRVVTGGGYHFEVAPSPGVTPTDPGVPDVMVFLNAPGSNGWRVFAENRDSRDVRVTAYALCLLDS